MSILNDERNKGMIPDVEVKEALKDISPLLRGIKKELYHSMNTGLSYCLLNKVKEIFASKVNSVKEDAAKLEICDAISSALSAASEKTEEGLKWEASFSPVKDSSDKVVDFDLGFTLYAADLEVANFKVSAPSNNDKSEITKGESDFILSESDFSNREEIIKAHEALKKIYVSSESRWTLYPKIFEQYMERTENNLKDKFSDDTFDITNSINESRKNIISLSREVEELLGKCCIKIDNFLQLKEIIKFCDDSKDAILNNASLFEDRSDQKKLLGKYFDNFLLTNEALSDSIKFSIKPYNVLEHKYPNALGDEDFINSLYEAGFEDYFVLNMAIEVEGIPAAWISSYQEGYKRAQMDGYRGEPLGYYLTDVLSSQNQVGSLLGSEKSLGKIKETLEHFAALDQNVINQLCSNCIEEYMETFTESLNKND